MRLSRHRVHYWVVFDILRVTLLVLSLRILSFPLDLNKFPLLTNKVWNIIFCSYVFGPFDKFYLRDTLLRFTLVYPLARSQNTILAPGNCCYEYVENQSRHVAGGPLLASLLCSTSVGWHSTVIWGCRLVQHHYFNHTFRPDLRASSMDSITWI